jgi:hypothetical protein
VIFRANSSSWARWNGVDRELELLAIAQIQQTPVSSGTTHLLIFGAGEFLFMVYMASKNKMPYNMRPGLDVPSFPYA